MEKRSKSHSTKAPVEMNNISPFIIQLVHDAIIVVDEEQNITLFNLGAEQTFGYEACEIIGQRLDILLPPQVSDFHLAYVRGFARESGIARFMGERREISARRKDGTIFPAEASIAKISHDGRTFFTAILRDITERKNAEQALSDSEEKHRLILNAVDEIIYQVNHSEGSLGSGTVEFVSERTQEVLGYKPIEFITDPNRWLSLIHPEDIPTVQAQTAKIMKTGQPNLRRYRIKDINGEYRWFEDRVSPQKDKTGRVVKTFGVARDITTGRLAEDALRKSEEKYRTLVEQAADGIFVADMEGNHVEVNTRACEMLGYTRAEILQLKISDLLKEEETSIRLDELKEGRTILTECELIRKDGSVIPTEVSVKMFPGGLLQAIVRDITQRRQAEVERVQLLNVLESSLNEIYIFDAESLRFQYVNQGALRNLGYSREAMSEMTPLDLKPEFDLNLFHALIEPLLLHEKEQLVFNTVHRRSNGSHYPVEVHLQLSDYDGKLVFHAIILDITERKQAEEATRKLYNAVEQSGDIIFITDRDGLIEYINPAFESVTGFSKEESIGKPPKILSSGLMEINYYQQIWTIILSGEVFRGEIVDRKKNGEIFHYDQTITPLKDERGTITHFVSTGKDVTERKRAEQLIETQLKHLNALHTIDTAITNGADLQFILNVVLEQTAIQLGIDAASILLFNPEKQVLEFATGLGFRTDAIKTASVPLGESFAGLATLERRFVQVLDLATAQENPGFAELWIIEGVASYFATPLIVKGQVKGALEIFHRTPITLTDLGDERLHFLETLAGQAAIAVENASLFDGMQRANLELTRAYDATIEGWSQAMDLRDKETEGHTLRVTALTVQLARAIGIREAEIIHLRRGALLHDMGKLGVPDSILLKPDKLTSDEWKTMKSHPQLAYDMLSPITYLKPALGIPYCHHEKWNGTGYPRGLKGEQIPLAARIFAIVDVYDALMSDRPYRKGWPKETTLDYIREESGKHFDPQLVESFMAAIDQFEKGSK